MQNQQENPISQPEVATQVNPVQPVLNQSSTPISSKKDSYTTPLLIVIILVLVAGMGFMFYKFSLLEKQLTERSQSEIAQKPLEDIDNEKLIDKSDAPSLAKDTVAQNTPDFDGEEYTTYTHPSSTISFSYPESWTIEKVNDTGRLFLYTPEGISRSNNPLRLTPPADLGPYNEMNVLILDSFEEYHYSDGSLSLDDWIENSDHGQFFIDIKKITVNGVEGYEGFEMGMSKSYTRIFSQNGKVVQMSIYNDKPNATELEIMNSLSF